MKALELYHELQENYSVKVYELKHFILPYHQHNSYELTLILKGSGTRIIGDCIDNYSPDDLILMGPFLPHVWKSDDKVAGLGVKSITIKLSEQFPVNGFFDLPEMVQIKAVLHQQISRGILLHGKLQKKIKQKVINLLQQSYPKQLLTILDILQSIAESTEYSTLASEGFLINKNYDYSKLSIITSYIFGNLGGTILLEDLADLVNMHPSAVGRYFKKNTGYSPVDYINRIRIGYVCRLLINDNLTISRACFDAGFNNLSHFNRIFKKLKGITPSEYLVKIKMM
jgi:AraC-like DNA-binding protein